MKPSPNQTPLPETLHSGHESHLLREVILTYQAFMSTFSRAVGMPTSRLKLLRMIAVNDPRPQGTMEIARRLGINPAAVSRLIKEMESLGLVERMPDTADARRSLVRLTENGREQFKILHERAHEFEHALASRLKEKDMATAIKVLSRIRESLQQA